jgi:hypothetical protein
MSIVCAIGKQDTLPVHCSNFMGFSSMLSLQFFAKAHVFCGSCVHD